MKSIGISRRTLWPSIAVILLAALAFPAMAVDLTTADGSWTFSISGEVNVDYVWSHCASNNPSSIPPSPAAGVSGGLACLGSDSGSSVSNIQNGLLPAAFTFGVATTQDGIDLAAHLGLYPGVATNNSGNPNIGPGGCIAANDASCNSALGTTGLDVRQVYMTFGNKDIGTFTLGRNIGLFGADVILADMTLPGVGGPGNAATAFPANTTLGGIGLGYIYTDWLAQIDYTTPDISGFNATIGIFDPINSLGDEGTVEAKKAPGVHAKITYTMPLGEGDKLYFSVAGIQQKQYYDCTDPACVTATSLDTPYTYNGAGGDLFGKLDLQGLEVVGYIYYAKGLGTTGLFDGGAFDDPGVELGETRKSYGYFGQVTYKVGPVKLGYNHGDSRLDFADAVDAAANPNLVRSNRKDTVGLYYSLTKALTLLGEVSYVRDDSGSPFCTAADLCGSNHATTVNVGAYLGF
jgi:predicted porin